MEARLCQESDLHQIIDIIKQNPRMYGVDLVSTGLQEAHIQGIKDYFRDLPDRVKIVGAFVNDQLVSFALMRFWESIPTWDALLLYSSANHFHLSDQEVQLEEVMKLMIKIAESRNVYNFYVITRFSKLWKRWHLFFLERFPDYTSTEAEILEPFQETKWPGFKKLLGPMNGKQEKSVVILNFLKSNYSKELKVLRKGGPA